MVSSSVLSNTLMEKEKRLQKFSEFQLWPEKLLGAESAAAAISPFTATSYCDDSLVC